MFWNLLPWYGMELGITSFPYPYLSFQYLGCNYVARFYDICESFLGWVYFLIFHKEAHAFSLEEKDLIATMGDWYISESLTYIRVYCRNTAHMLPKVMPDRLVLEEISFQTVKEGI